MGPNSGIKYSSLVEVCAQYITGGLALPYWQASVLRSGRILLIVGSLKLWEYDIQTPRVLPEEFCAAAN